MVNIFIKKIFEYFSFPYNLRSEKLSKRQIRIQNTISQSANKNTKKNLLNTHKIFSKEVYNLIKSGNLKNFLRKNFIQRMFFIHNRFFLIPHFFEIFFSKNLKKLLIEDTIGNPVPFFLYKKTSGNRIRCVFHLKKILDFCKNNKMKNDFDLVVEVGGGYGCFARIYKLMRPKTKFILFDTPEVSMLQSYYLRSLNYEIGINKFSKNISIYYDYKKLEVLLKKLKRKKILFISTWALSEMPKNLRKNILKNINLYSAYVVAFQNTFEDINNFFFFKGIQKKMEKNFFNTIDEIKSMNFLKFKIKHYYLLALKKNEKNL